MHAIERCVTFDAPIEAVYALVSDVEAFADYSALIESIEPLGEGRWCWRVKAAGMALSWEAEVSEAEPPHLFAWRSVTGVQNSGRYDLQALVDGRTQVTLTMRYHIPGRWLEKAVARVADPLIRKVGDEVLARVCERLTSGAGSSG